MSSTFRSVFPTLISGLIFAGVLSAPAAQAPPSVEQRFKTDVSYLADDARDGRAPGTKGIEDAADFIAKRFESLGLKTAPGADGYFQPFELGFGAVLEPNAKLELPTDDGKTLEAKLNTDFRPLALGSGGTVQGAAVVFAGFGITAKDPARGLDYDEYEGIDVKGKVVLIIRRQPTPEPNDKGEPGADFAGKKDSDFATFRHKAVNAFQHGAVAILCANDSTSLVNGADNLIPFMVGGGDLVSDVPYVMITRSFADQILAKSSDLTLADLEKQINHQLKPKSRELEKSKVDLALTINRPRVRTKNVVGVLEGEGPHANETIIVGAHYDHLGHGGVGSGSLAFFSKEIHNGADDNASGTSMMLEMARRLAARPDRLPRRIVFMAFSGEEKGLLGSAHYAAKPLYPLADAAVMVNFDMVGRLNSSNELTVYGTGTSPGLETIVDSLGKAAGFTIKKIADGDGPSDHATFYRKGLPVLFLFTGTHLDYHRPSDDSERINFEGMVRVADLGELLLLDLARRPIRPAFVRVKPTHGGGQDVGRLSVSAYLGTMPSYDDGGKGVKLDGVREDSPAEKAGLKEGDVIIGFGGKPIKTVYDYTESLSQYKPGDVVEVVVRRDGREAKLKVTLGTRPN